MLRIMGPIWFCLTYLCLYIWIHTILLRFVCTKSKDIVCVNVKGIYTRKVYKITKPKVSECIFPLYTCTGFSLAVKSHDLIPHLFSNTWQISHGFLYCWLQFYIDLHHLKKKKTRPQQVNSEMNKVMISWRLKHCKAKNLLVSCHYCN